MQYLQNLVDWGMIKIRTKQLNIIAIENTINFKRRFPNSYNWDTIKEASTKKTLERKRKLLKDFKTNYGYLLDFKKEVEGHQDEDSDDW